MIGLAILMVWGGFWWYQIEREQTRITSLKETSIGYVVDIDFFSDRGSGPIFIILKLDSGDVVYGRLNLYHHVDVGTFVNVTHSMKKIIELKVLVPREEKDETVGGTKS